MHVAPLHLSLDVTVETYLRGGWGGMVETRSLLYLSAGRVIGSLCNICMLSFGLHAYRPPGKRRISRLHRHNHIPARFFLTLKDTRLPGSPKDRPRAFFLDQ
jgi:hypothetical protein